MTVVFDLEMLVAYDPETGTLWRLRELKTTTEDSTSGRTVTRSLPYEGKSKQSTHIIWKLMTGNWPIEGAYIDHKNGIPNDMSWENLREATPVQSAYNRQSKGRYVDADLGLENGVRRQHNRFAVTINGIRFGSFNTMEEANALAKTKRQELQGEFMRVVRR